MRGAARMGDRTPTQDVVSIARPPTVFIENRPAATVGDQVFGPIIIGTIMSGSGSVEIEMQAAAYLTSEVSGTGVQTGAPLSTVLAFTSTTVYIGA